ncbi:MAG: Uma2 family endonuclease [bacterium]
MPQTARKLTPENLQFTYEDYLLLPDDGKRYEIIEGELFMTPAPIIKHQNVLRELGKHIDNFVGVIYFIHLRRLRGLRLGNIEILWRLRNNLRMVTH